MEYELRIGRIVHGKYEAGVPRGVWYQCLQNFPGPCTISKDMVERKGNMRRITSLTTESVVVEEKRLMKIEKDIYGEYEFRFVTSMEIPSQWRGEPDQTFTRTRLSFPGPGYRVEFTHAQAYYIEIEFEKEFIPSIVEKVKRYLHITTVSSRIVEKIREKLPVLVNPVNVKRDLLPELKSYKVTNKLNGVRKLLVVQENILYTSDPKLREVRQLFPVIFQDIIVECEEYFGDYYMYDVVASPLVHEARLVLLAHLHETIGSANFQVKEFRPVSQTQELLSSLDKEENDGIIFTSQAHPYETTRSYKWKWPEELTIDFRAVVNADQTSVTLMYKGKEGELPFERDGVLGTLPYSSDIPKDAVCEFAWRENSFVFIRERRDKDVPNYQDTVFSVWYDIQHPIHIPELIELLSARGKNVELRSFHNSVKASLLKECTSTVLDIGFGKGGDYKKYRAQHIYAVEPNEQYRFDFKLRHPTQKNVTWIPCSGANTGEIASVLPSKATHGVSMFSLTFFFEYEELLKDLVRTIDRCVSSTFLGVTLDGNALLDSLGQNTKKSWGENIHVERQGHQIIFNFENSQTVSTNQVEYMVDFPYFTTLMQEVGFVLEKSEFFQPPFSSEEAEFSRLNRWFIFRRREIQKDVLLLPRSSNKILSCILAHKGVNPHSPPKFAVDIKRNDLVQIAVHDPHFTALLESHGKIPLPRASVEFTILWYLANGGTQSVLEKTLEEYKELFQKRIFKEHTPEVLQFWANKLHVTIDIDGTLYYGGRGTVRVEENHLRCYEIWNQDDFSHSLWE